MVYIVTAGFIILDFVTGLIKAFRKKEYNSSLMREGLFHKVGSVIAVAFGALVDYSQGFLDLGVSIPVAVSICVYVCLMEIGSIIENLAEINPRIIPSKIRQYFHKLNSEEKEVKSVDDVQSKKG